MSQGRATEYGIYFDESYRPYQATEDVVYIYTAALIKNSAKKQLERNLTRLRQEMTETALRIAPHLENHPKIAGGQLIEIHAVDLYQSSGIWREVKRIKRNFYPQQHEWLRQCLEYAAGSGVEYFTYSTTRTEHQRIWGWLAEMWKNVPLKSVREKLDSLNSNPYIIHLPVLLAKIDDHLIEKNGYADMFCHTYDDGKGFSTIDAFALARARGHYARVKSPLFRTCSEEQVIQCADAAGYVLLQFLYASMFKTNAKPEFRRWAKDYIVDRWIERSSSLDNEKSKSLTAILMEFLMLNTDGPKEYQDVIQAKIPSVITNILMSQDSLQPIAPRDVFLARPITNRPPSEEGDLYMGSLEPTPETVKENRVDSDDL